MRPLTIHTTFTVALAAVVAFGIPVTGHASSPPGGDGADPLATAQAEFERLAADRGVALVDPVCVDTEVVSTYTCYGRTDGDELLVATVDLGGDEPVAVVVSEPSATATGATAPSADSSSSSTTTSSTSPPDDEPNLGPISAAELTFDPLRFFDGLYSGDLERIEEQAGWVQPGSPAAAYLDYQRRNLSIGLANGVDSSRAYVYQTPDSVRVCLTGDSCIEIDNLVVEREQLVSFDIDGERLVERLARPTEPIVVGSTTVQLELAYQTVTSDQVVVFLHLTGTGDERLELTTSTYVAFGTQTAVDPSIGAPRDGAVIGPTTVQLVFPDSVLGGEVRILVRPLDGSTPLAAVIPVEPLVEPS